MLDVFPPDSPALPALDWQLQSSSGPYTLQIDVQPKSHHRAHYETEGSRGAVKAMAGGHPVVQVCLFLILFGLVMSAAGTTPNHTLHVCPVCELQTQPNQTLGFPSLIVSYKHFNDAQQSSISQAGETHRAFSFCLLRDTLVDPEPHVGHQTFLRPDPQSASIRLMYPPPPPFVCYRL